MPLSQRLLHLSLEHQTAMKLARGIRELMPEDDSALPAVAEHIRQIYASDMLAHFQEEEHHVCPALLEIGRQDLVDRVRDDHKRLGELANALAEPSVERLEAFSELLREHVQFEEEEVFEALEQHAKQKASAVL
ncbi:hemerythrin domain-containing protein [Paraburkholderia sp.]|uniref:hemerythrin domain-containing protein n=1 Tax=Paraburkholderia sp. TaxID=1926495 RepID=UPI00286F99FC|nr:hemerythrin domain-containing protein [Paraburkholderia sp.]